MKRIPRKYVENGLCLLVLTAVAALARYPIWLEDKAPADISALFNYQPWEDARPPEFREPAEVAREPLHFYAWYTFLHDTAARRDSPLWSPRELCGVPFMALWSTRVFSPFSLPVYLLPLMDALQLAAMLKLLVAGWSAFYVARRLGFSAAPALFVAVAFELSGVFLLWHAYPLSDVVPWLPLWVLFLNQLAVGQYRYWPFGGIVLGLMLAGGDPRAVAMLVLFGFIFLLFQHGKLRPVRPWLQATGSLSMGVLVGLLLLGVQIAPYLEWLQHAAPPNAHHPPSLPRISDLIVVILPKFFGTTHEGIGSSSYGWNPQTAGVVYAGLTSILLLVLWASLRFSAPDSLRRRVEGLLVTSLLVSACGMLVGRYAEPFLYPRHFFLANDFVFALTGAAAVEEWVELNALECKRALKRFFAVLVAIAGVVALVVWLRMNDPRPDAPELATQIMGAATITATFIVLLAITVLKPSRRLTAYGASLLIAGELLWTYMPRMAHVDAAQFFPETEFIRAVRGSGGRVAGGPVMAQWPLGVHDISQVYGPREAQSKRFDAFAARLAEDPLLVRRTASDTLLLTKRDIHGPFATARSSLQIRHVLPTGAIVFEDLDVKPRAWMAYDWVPESAGASARIASNAPPVVETTVPPPNGGTADSPADRVALESGNTYVRVDVELTRPGLLILADAYYPGWTAYIDSTPTPILAVDGMFRGVEVGKGSHSVEFVYEPRSVRLGLILSATGAGLVVLGAVVMAWPSRMRRRRATAGRTEPHP